MHSMYTPGVLVCKHTDSGTLMHEFVEHVPIYDLVYYDMW